MDVNFVDYALRRYEQAIVHNSFPAYEILCPAYKGCHKLYNKCDPRAGCPFLQAHLAHLTQQSLLDFLEAVKDLGNIHYFTPDDHFRALSGSFIIFLRNLLKAINNVKK